MATDNNPLTNVVAAKTVNGVLMPPDMTKKADPEVLANPYGNTTAGPDVRVQEFTGEAAAKTREQNTKSFQLNNQDFTGKAWDAITSSLRGGFFDSAKDKVVDLVGTYVVPDPTYSVTPEDLLNRHPELTREQAVLMAQKSGSLGHEELLVERLKDRKEAQQVLSMLDTSGKVMAFGGTALDSLPLAFLPGGAVARLGTSATRMARLGTAVGANAAVGVGMEALQADTGMTEFSAGDAAKSALLNGVFGVLDMKVAPRVKGAPASVVNMPNVVPEGAVAKTAAVMTDGPHATILRGEWKAELAAGVKAAQDAVRAVAREQGPLAAKVAAETEGVLLAQRLGIPNVDGAFLSKLTPDEAAEYMHAKTLEDMRENIDQLPGGAEANQLALEEAIGVSQKTLGDMASRTEGAVLDVSPAAPKISARLEAPEGITRTAPEVEVEGHTMRLQFDNAVDQALFNLRVGSEAEQQAAREYLQQALPTHSAEELAEAGDELLSNIQSKVPASESVFSAHYSSMRVHSTGHILEEFDAARRADLEEQTHGLGADTAVDPAVVAKVDPGIPVVDTPVVAVTEGGELKGRWTARPTEIAKEAWNKATEVVRAVNAKNVKELLSAESLKEHADAVFARLVDAKSESLRLAKHLMAREVAGKLTGKQAVVLAAGVGAAGTAAASTGETSEGASLAALSLLGLPFLKGKFRKPVRITAESGAADKKAFVNDAHRERVLQQTAREVEVELMGKERAVADALGVENIDTKGRAKIVKTLVEKSAKGEQVLVKDAPEVQKAVDDAQALIRERLESIKDDLELEQFDNDFVRQQAGKFNRLKEQAAETAEAPKAAVKTYSDASVARTVEAYPDKSGKPNPQGHLANGVLNPTMFRAESVVLPETDKLHLAKMKVRVPVVMKEQTEMRIGFSIADYPGASESNTARFIQSDLMNSVSGRKAGNKTGERVATNKMTADVTKKMFMQKHFGSAIVDTENLFQEWAKDQGTNVLKRRYTKEPARRFFEEVGMVIRGQETDNAFVKQAAERFRKAFKDAMDETHRVLGTLPKDLPEDSLLAIYREFKFDPKYLPRLWDGAKFMEVHAKARDMKDVYRLFADSFQYSDGVRPPLEKRLAVAEGLVNLVTALKNDASIGDLSQMTAAEIALTGKKLGISDEALDAYLSFGGVDAQRFVSGRLKARIKLDELAAPIQIPTKDGGTMELRIADLMVNDPRSLLGTWLNMSSGIYAMGLKAADSGLDYTSEKLWENLRNQMVREGATAKEIEYVMEFRNYLLAAGKTTTIMKEESQLGKTIRNLTLLKNSTNFVYATLGELGYNKTIQVMGRNGIGDFLGNIVTLAKTGTLDNALARDIQAAMGTGLEGLTPTVSNMIENNAMDTVDGLLTRAISDKFKLSGFQQVNAYAQTVVQAVALGRLVEYARMSRGATGLRTLSDGEWERLRSFGLGKEELDEMVDLLNKHAKLSEGSGLDGFDFKAMSVENPVLTAKLQGSLFRMGKFATSDEAGAGEILPFMTGDIGKTVFQFQAVVARSFAKGKRALLIRDADEALRVLMSFAGAALGYIAKINVVYAMNAEEREKRLDMAEVMKAGFRNMALSGPLPAGIDAVSSTLFGVAPFADVGNSDKTTRASIAAWDTLNSAMNTLRGAVSNVRSDKDQLSQKEITEMAKYGPVPHYMMPFLAFVGDQMGLQEKDPRPVPEKKAD